MPKTSLCIEKEAEVAFKIAVGQELTSDHKKQRREFCQWLLDQPEDLPQKIIFGDEKWFVLTAKIPGTGQLSTHSSAGLERLKVEKSYGFCGNGRFS